MYLYEPFPWIRLLHESAAHFGTVSIRLCLHLAPDPLVPVLGPVLRRICEKRWAASTQPSLQHVDSSVSLVTNGDVSSLVFTMVVPVMGRLIGMELVRSFLEAVELARQRSTSLTEEDIAIAAKFLAKVRRGLQESLTFAYTRCAEEMDPPGPSIYERMETVSLSIAALQDAVSQMLSQSTVSVVLIGPLDEAEVRREFLNYSRRLRVDVIRAPGARTMPKRKPSRHLQESRGEAQTTLVFGLQCGTTIRSDEYPTLIALGALVAGDPSSLVFRLVRAQLGAGYLCMGEVDPVRGRLYIATQVPATRAGKVAAAIERIVEQVNNGHVTAAALRCARQVARRNCLLAHDKPLWALDLFTEQLAGGRVWPLPDLADRCQALSDEQLRCAAANTYLDVLFRV